MAHLSTTVISSIPFLPCTYAPPTPSLEVIALPAISEQQFCLCSGSVCQKRVAC